MTVHSKLDHELSCSRDYEHVCLCCTLLLLFLIFVTSVKEVLQYRNYDINKTDYYSLEVF